MPYLTEQRKKELDELKFPPLSGGDLTYLLTKVCLEGDPESFYGRIYEEIYRYLPKEGIRYENYCTVLGSLVSTAFEYERRRNSGGNLEAALGMLAQEFYENVVAPYETKKIQQNGDLF